MRLGEIAERLGQPLEGDVDFVVVGVASLDEGEAGDLGFVRSSAQLDALAGSAIGALVAPPGLDVGARPVIRSPRPSLDFARAVGFLRPPPRAEPGVHASAVVDASAELGAGVSLGPHVAIGAHARVGAGSVLHANVSVYAGVEIGEACVLHAGSVVREGSVLGARVVLQPCAVIGGDGFGYEFDEAGRLEKVPQVGRVVLEDDVEVGSCTTIDRARLGTTRVGRGVKIDNLVQIGHGCEIGEDSAIVAQVGLAGSSRLGRHVFVMAQAGVANHARIGDGSFIGGRGGVVRDLPPGSRVYGFPALSERAWHRAMAAFPRLPELLRRLRALEKRIAGATSSRRGRDRDA